MKRLIEYVLVLRKGKRNSQKSNFAVHLEFAKFLMGDVQPTTHLNEATGCTSLKTFNFIERSLDPMGRYVFVALLRRDGCCPLRDFLSLNELA